MKLADLQKELRVRMDKYKMSICSNSEFTEEFRTYIKSSKKSFTIEDSELIFCPQKNSILIVDSVIKNSVIRYSPIDIVNSELNNVKVYNCNFFQFLNSKMNDATFIGGNIEIQQDHPIVFEFPHGTITNSKPGFINFFGYENTYDFFRNNLDTFPFSNYATELGSIVVMGPRVSDDDE